MRSSVILLVSGVLCAAPLRAQLVSNPNNWGVTLGLDLFTADYDPSGPDHPSGSAPFAFPTRGWGARINGGVVFLKHFVGGGETGVVMLRGDKHIGSPGFAEYDVVTQNSIVSSVYVGWISTPMGGSARAGRKWWAGALLGRERWGGERQITVCAGCATQGPLHEKSGNFIEPFVVWGGGDRNGGGGFKLAYRTPLQKAPTVRGQVSLGLYFNFLKL